MTSRDGGSQTVQYASMALVAEVPCSVSFEELNSPFMVLGCLEAVKRSEILPFPCFWIFLA